MKSSSFPPWELPGDDLHSQSHERLESGVNDIRERLSALESRITTAASVTGAGVGIIAAIIGAWVGK